MEVAEAALFRMAKNGVGGGMLVSKRSWTISIKKHSTSDVFKRLNYQEILLWKYVFH